MNNKQYKIENEVLFQGTIGCDCGIRNKCSGFCKFNHYRIFEMKNWKYYRLKQYRINNA